MSTQGPLVVIGEAPEAALSELLSASGAFPIVEAACSAAADVIAAASPQAILLSDPKSSADTDVARAIENAASPKAPYLPVLARASADQTIAFAQALAIDVKAPAPVVAARLATACRVRSLHATVLRRSRMLEPEPAASLELLSSNPLEDATVIVAGRGRTYPVLSTAIGERAGLIGALRIETAASYLKARDIDGLILGDGFGLRSVDALLTVIGEDARFRDLPIGVLGGPDRSTDEVRMPILQAYDPHALLARVLPYVHMHALEQRLKRMLLSLDREGRLDPLTGLLFGDAFMRELNDALADSVTRGTGLSLARFTFESGLGQRAGHDAARLVSRLIRGIDFGCRDDDGSILVAFTETDLRHAHIIARRLASVLKHTMLSPGDRRPASPAITLATRKSVDNAASLLDRVTAAPAAAE